MITDAFPPQRGKAMGFNIAAIYLGTTIRPVPGDISSLTLLAKYFLCKCPNRNDINSIWMVRIKTRCIGQ